jgi:BAI1-associated protein 3
MQVRQQKRMFLVFLSYESRAGGNSWGGALPGPAATILHQHAVQGDLTSLQVALAHWAGAARHNLDTTLDGRHGFL